MSDDDNAPESVPPSSREPTQSQRLESIAEAALTMAEKASFARSRDVLHYLNVFRSAKGAIKDMRPDISRGSYAGFSEGTAATRTAPDGTAELPVRIQE